ncbi:MAG: flagellar biosynthesis protein FlhF [Gammaproteobacteria bacterium]|nr:flagellar biosynthesis protein FlhF [Gammaproteobacteria bacterium]
MKIKRYFAEDMRQAIRKVREAQGSDAVILSNRKVEGGIEIVAAVDYDESLLVESAGGAPHPGVKETALSPAEEKDHAERSTLQNKAKGNSVQGGSEITWSQEPAMRAMREELNSIRGLLEHQLSGLAWGELGRRKPQRVALLRRLMALELSPGLARETATQVAESLPPQAAWRKALGLIARRLTTINDGILTNGGIVALVGPTGVGKTTTVAKLAARFALQHGAEKVALVTTDSYRVGAVEQLRTYGRIMGIPVRVTNGEEELRIALDDLYGKRLVLIDTAGMSQRDIRLSEQLATLQNSVPMVETYLVLSATTQAWGLEETIKAFRGVELAGCIITKLDEATGLGNVLSSLIQQQLAVAYTGDGQRVPEDIQPARAQTLVARAVKIMNKSSRNFTDESMELAYGKMAANGSL